MTQQLKKEKRTRFFLGCEGESEYAYGAFLQCLADDKDQCNIHIFRTILQPGAGSPVVLAEKAIKKYKDEFRKRGPFLAKAIMLDLDNHKTKPIREQQEFRRILKEENFIVIWQKPDHEGFLLNHFCGYENVRPPNGKADQALKKVWRCYDKPMNAESINKKLSIKDVCRLSRVHAEFRKFLKAIGLIC